MVSFDLVKKMFMSITYKWAFLRSLIEYSKWALNFTMKNIIVFVSNL